MDPNEEPSTYVLVRHFYGVASAAALLKATMDNAAQVAEQQGLMDVAETIKSGYVDDLSNSLDTLEAIKQLQQDLKKFLTAKSLPLKGYAITGSLPDKSLSPDDSILVGGWYWFSKSDSHSLKTPRIFQGKLKKGRFLPGTIFLDSPQSKQEIQAFYKQYPVTLAHILSRTSMVYDQTGSVAPLAGYGRWITRQALIQTEGVFTKQVSETIKQLFLDFIYQTEMFGRMKMKRNHGLARDYRSAILYYDAGEAGQTFILHLHYEKDRRGFFYSEFLFAAHSLVPLGRNIQEQPANLIQDTEHADKQQL
jgi:hypothetical protein